MVALLTNTPTPYRIPLFNSIADQLAQRQFHLQVLFAMPTYHRRQWQNVLAEARFEYQILDLPRVPWGEEYVLAIPRRLSQALRALRATCLVLGGFSLLALSGASFAQRHRIPYIIWSGETIAEAQRRRGKSVRRFLRHQLTRRASACIAYGTRAQEYLQTLGVTHDRIRVAVNCVDTDFFRDQVSARRSLLTAPSHAVGARLLFIGHLQRRKGLDSVLHALKLCEHLPVNLDVVGDGPARAHYEHMAAELGLHNVIFHGFRQKAELPDFYAAADLFVFPSLQEIFGLVLVEAAAAGLPIIASKFAGGTVDVVQEGRNGFVVDPTDILALAQRIKELCLNPAMRAAMGRQSLQIVAESVNIQRSAEGFVQAVLSCVP